MNCARKDLYNGIIFVVFELRFTLPMLFPKISKISWAVMSYNDVILRHCTYFYRIPRGACQREIETFPCEFDHCR